LDPRQAIYAWRGADSEVYNNLKNRFNPKELILPICYRCPRKVVELAQKLVPDIIPFEKSKEGEIIKLDISELVKTAKPGSYVLSRVNAPLIKYCMQFIKNGTPANILGRDIGAGLYYLIKKSGKKTIKDLLKWLVVWEAEEKERILIKYPKANVEFLADKAECIRMLCEDMTSLEEVRENINKMFQDNDESKIVLFSSIHRIKGKETDDVFVLEDTLKSSSEEELNIQYVAFTRAKFCSTINIVEWSAIWAKALATSVTSFGAKPLVGSSISKILF
jgi:superfamily I DNA/RNA helicase